MKISKARPLVSLLFGLLGLLGLAASASAQLPADAVDLSLVKIPETIQAEDLCPVTLQPSVADGEEWTWKGRTFRGAEPGVEEKFLADPETYAEAHRRKRWMENFMLAMSTIWCPITDEVTPGGRKQIEAHGYKWESCCSFCDEELRPENLDQALVLLEERAAEAYELTGGTYEDADSPVAGAIRDDY